MHPRLSHLHRARAQRPRPSRHHQQPLQKRTTPCSPAQVNRRPGARPIFGVIEGLHAWMSPTCLQSRGTQHPSSCVVWSNPVNVSNSTGGRPLLDWINSNPQGGNPSKNSLIDPGTAHPITHSIPQPNERIRSLMSRCRAAAVVPMPCDLKSKARAVRPPWPHGAPNRTGHVPVRSIEPRVGIASGRVSLFWVWAVVAAPRLSIVLVYQH